VRFTIGTNRLAHYDLQMKHVVAPGLYTIYVGGNSVDVLEKELKLRRTERFLIRARDSDTLLAALLGAFACGERTTRLLGNGAEGEHVTNSSGV